MKQHEKSYLTYIVSTFHFLRFSLLTTLVFVGAATATPTVPTNLSPGTISSPGPTLSGTSVTLQWSAPSSGNLIYDFGVRDLTTNTLIVDTTTTNTSFGVSNLVEGHQYRWNIRACDGTACSNFTSPLYFQTSQSVSIPSVPFNLSPGSTSSPGPTLSGNLAIFTWDSSESAITNYDIGVRDLTTNELILDTTTTNNHIPVANLVEGRQYRWNLRACNSSGCSNFTTPLYFQTPQPVLPPVPTNLSPGDNIGPGPIFAPAAIVFNWDSSIANFFNFVITDVVENKEVVNDNEITIDRRYLTALRNGKEYSWKVRGCNSNGCSQFTAPLFFRTKASTTYTRNISIDLNNSAVTPQSDGTDFWGAGITNVRFDPVVMGVDDKLILNFIFLQDQQLQLNNISVNTDELFLQFLYMDTGTVNEIGIGRYGLVLGDPIGDFSAKYENNQGFKCLSATCGMIVHMNITDTTVTFSSVQFEFRISRVDFDVSSDKKVTFDGVQQIGLSAQDIKIIADTPPEYDCGPNPIDDCDGDGLLNEWESGPVMLNGESIDLSAMGADPYRKDIFVELDYMDSKDHFYRPNDESLKIVTDSFNAAPVSNPNGVPGIALHIDAGPSSLTNEGYLTRDKAKTWKGLSRATAIPADQFVSGKYVLDDCVSWQSLDDIKNIYFDKSRKQIFSYSISAHSVCKGSELSGRARAPNLDKDKGDISGSDFLVTLQYDSNDTHKFAGTFMHELGHNLGLWHDGEGIDINNKLNYKPNYLSVMNYSFQQRGIIFDENYVKFDYSRFKLPTLNEKRLFEEQGIMENINGNFQSIAGSEGYGTIFNYQKVNDINAPIDWNAKDGIQTEPVIEDLNCRSKFGCNNKSIDLLTGHNDWESIKFKRGFVGGDGLGVLPVIARPETLLELDANSPLPPGIRYAVTIDGPSVINLAQGSYGEYVYQIKNIGEVFAIYYIVADPKVAWIDMSAIPSVIQLESNETMTFKIYINVPLVADMSTVIRPTITVTSVDNARMLDAITLDVRLSANTILGDLDGDGDVDRNDINIIMALRNTQATGPDDPNDIDGDGTITVLDARRLMLLCTRARCAVN